VRLGLVKTGFFPLLFILPLVPIAGQSATPGQAAARSASGVSVSIYERSRIENWQWFATPPQSETYSYIESTLRIGVSQQIRKFDWQLELSQPSALWAPKDAVSPVTAQGQMGLGATYYASNGNNQNAAAAFLKQGYIRYHAGPDKSIRIGRSSSLMDSRRSPAIQISHGCRPTESHNASSAISASALRSAALTVSMGTMAAAPGT